jgi:uncharacterized protein (DUF305 family)
MFTVERHQGRLIEVRTISPVSLAEIADADIAMGEAAASGGRIFICADHRKLAILGTEQADQFIAMFRRHNQAIELSAIVVAPTSATAILQMERVIAEAQNPNRRAFRSTKDAANWLRPHLTSAEAARINAFFAGSETP